MEAISSAHRPFALMPSRVKPRREVVCIKEPGFKGKQGWIFRQAGNWLISSIIKNENGNLRNTYPKTFSKF